VLAQQLRNQLPPDLARDLPRSAVYAYLITFCLYLGQDTADEIEQRWGLSSDEAYRLGIRSVPTLIGNLVASTSCADHFAEELLRQTPGFYWFDRHKEICTCFEFSDLCVCELRQWRIDIDSCWASRGVIVPRHNRVGWISELIVFRHLEDTRPFPLKVRSEVAA
jgi:hypothetical protein